MFPDVLRRAFLVVPPSQTSLPTKTFIPNIYFLIKASAPMQTPVPHEGLNPPAWNSDQQTCPTLQILLQNFPSKHVSCAKYSTTLRAEIGQYTHQHGADAAAWYFSKKLEKPKNENMVKSIKKAHIEQLWKRVRIDDEEELATFPAKKYGCFCSPWTSTTRYRYT